MRVRGTTTTRRISCRTEGTPLTIPQTFVLPWRDLVDRITITICTIYCDVYPNAAPHTLLHNYYHNYYYYIMKRLLERSIYIIVGTLVLLHLLPLPRHIEVSKSPPTHRKIHTHTHHTMAESYRIGLRDILRFSRHSSDFVTFTGLRNQN